MTKNLTSNLIIDLSGQWEFCSGGTTGEKLMGTVPGCVHLDLMANHKIPDPYYRDNEKKVQWVGLEDWQYRRQFEVPAGFLESNPVLVCEGLDTFALIYVNGNKLGSTENMFRKYQFPVGQFLHDGTNEIIVYFSSPIKQILPQLARHTVKLPSMNETEGFTGPYTRKAPYHFGWDWGPRLVTMGIWRPIYITGGSGPGLENLYLRPQFLYKNRHIDRVILHGSLDLVNADQAGKVTGYRIRLTDEDGKVIEQKITNPKGAEKLSFQLRVDSPKLWWPNGSGSAHLYQLEMCYLEEPVTTLLQTRIGIRKIRLVQENDSRGQSFQFEVNDVPIFAKGGNWIPAEVLLPRLQRQDYEYLLESCRQVHMNMLRVWGGGIYESQDFYDLCDEKGLLVWQDFMFSCAQYPGDDDFIHNVKQEIDDNIKRIRHHACVALWCGNNEIEMGWQEWNWKTTLPPGLFRDYLKLFYQIIPNLVEANDPDRHYWPSSPAGADISNPNDENTGDMHYWGVWHGNKSIDDYRKIQPRFASEFGFQSFPLMKNVKKFTIPEDWNISHPVLELHQKSYKGNKAILFLMLDYYRMPKDFSSFLWLSQVLQAEAMKTAVEHFRSLQPHCMGALYWQVNDCWPVASWAGIDYYGTWKALHYYAKKFFNPTLVCPVLENNRIIVKVISELFQGRTATLHWRLAEYDGNIIKDGCLAVTIAPHRSQTCCELALSEITELNPVASYFHVELMAEGQLLSDNILHFCPMKQIDWPEVELRLDWQKSGSDFNLKMITTRFVKNVYLEIAGSDDQFSDNFFDLVPGRAKIIHLSPGSATSCDELTAKLKIMTLRDTY